MTKKQIKGPVQLGDKVRDTITGFVGIAIADIKYIHGCRRISVQPPLDKDGKHPDAVTFDEPQLEIVSRAKEKKKNKSDPGGPPTKDNFRRAVPRR